MFDKEKNIIFITRDKIRGAVVVVDTTARIEKDASTPWTDQDLDISLGKILAQFSSKKVRLLLGKDLSYVLKLTIPTSDKEMKEREEVYELIKDQIPEELEDDDWDYKVTESNEKEMQILAFAPVKEVFRSISNALKKNDCVIDAVEPEEVAVTRNSDPVIGMALKKDVRGKDEDSLNIGLTEGAGEMPEVLTDKKDGIPSPSVAPPKTLIRREVVVILIITLIVGLIVAGGIVVSKRSTAEVPVATETAVPEVIATPTPTPEIDLSSYSVRAQNGSGIPGQAGSLAEKLEAGGFENIETGNSDSFDYEGITVRIKEEVSSDQLKEKINQILADMEMQVVFENNLTDDEEFDLLFIIGK